VAVPLRNIYVKLEKQGFRDMSTNSGYRVMP